MKSIVAFWIVITCCCLARADGPADNHPDSVRPVPPPGIKLDPGTVTELRSAAERQRQRLSELSSPAPTKEERLKQDLIEVIPRAIEITLDTDMFYSEQEVEQARDLLQLGEARIDQLSKHGTLLELLGIPRAEQPLAEPLAVVGGFRSRLDDSVQPYGLVLPAGWKPGSKKPLRLDVWLHGRGEKTSEAAFLQQRRRQLGEYTPADTLVLHPYGRYSNAFKFAGEIDVLEAIEHVKQLLPIDEARIVIRGFSMGGAGCWQLAVHYPDIWAAANPGAGFSETTQFLRVFQQEAITPTDYQQRLLHWYDCPDWANNLRQVPTVAYSGEKDRQKQAADVMVAAFDERGMKLQHVIGPNTEHKIHADSKIEVQAFIDSALQAGKPLVPRTIDLTTYTLRYHKLAWLSIEGLAEHWQEARVQAQWLEQDRRVELKTQGVTRLALRFPAETSASIELISLDGQTLKVAEAWPATHETLVLARDSAGKWSMSVSDVTGLAKVPGLQGPIDDAFMDRFVMIPPAEKHADSPVDRWIRGEYEHARTHWRRQMRGDVPVHEADDLRTLNLEQNLVLFGRPATNPLIAEIVAKLPIQWSDQTLIVNGVSYDARSHVPALIYPNPLQPKHYVVINSGFTYREYAYLNNARQVPMLPDWAVIDVRQGATSQLPGKIPAAGFFDEQWQISRPSSDSRL